MQFRARASRPGNLVATALHLCCRATEGVRKYSPMSSSRNLEFMHEVNARKSRTGLNALVFSLCIHIITLQLRLTALNFQQLKKELQCAILNTEQLMKELPAGNYKD